MRRRLLLPLALLLLVAGFFGARAGLRRLSFFSIRRVELVGARYLDAAAVARALALPEKASVFDSKREWTGRVRALPGVLDAEIGRRLPGTLRVRVQEAEPVALAPSGNKLVLVSVTPSGAEPITEVTDPYEVDRLVGLCQQADPHSTTKAFEQVFRQLAREPVVPPQVGPVVDRLVVDLEHPVLHRQRVDEACADRSVGRENEDAVRFLRQRQFGLDKRDTLTRYCRPLARLHLDEIDTAAVLEALQPIWRERPETARRLRGRIERVLDAARVEGHRSGENPATWRGHLEALLSRHDPR